MQYPKIYPAPALPIQQGNPDPRPRALSPADPFQANVNPGMSYGSRPPQPQLNKPPINLHPNPDFNINSSFKIPIATKKPFFSESSDPRPTTNAGLSSNCDLNSLSQRRKQPFYHNPDPIISRQKGKSWNEIPARFSADNVRSQMQPQINHKFQEYKPQPGAKSNSNKDSHQQRNHESNHENEDNVELPSAPSSTSGRSSISTIASSIYDPPEQYIHKTPLNMNNSSIYTHSSHSRGTTLGNNDNNVVTFHSQWESNDIESLCHLLEVGERAKWKYISTQLSNIREKRITTSACQKKFKEMFGVSEGLSVLGSSLCYIIPENGWNCLDCEEVNKIPKV